MNISQEQNAATGELVDLIASRAGENRAIHPETAISAAARLSGSLLLRSFNLDLGVGDPGDVLLSEEANEKGPTLINIVAGFLSASGLEINPENIGGEEKQRGEPPRLKFNEALLLLQDDALTICNKYNLSMEECAYSAALATAFIVKECAPQIGSDTGFNVAAYSFIEGCKTVPPKLKAIEKLGQNKKPWYKVW